MRWSLLKTLAAASLCAFHFTSQAGELRPSDIRKIIPSGANIIGYNAENGELILMGLFAENTARDVKAQLDAHPDIKVVYLHSPGGDIDAAIEIAALIRKRKLNVVVDGLCFSACAHYIFPAAVRKTVLPGSVVGIHQTSATIARQGPSVHAEDDAVMPMQTAAVRMLEEGRVSAYYQLLAQQLGERRFYADFGIDPTLNRIYTSYAARRDARRMAFGDPRFQDATCPNLRMWVLDKQQLISMGITGISAFWYPRSQADWDRVAALGVPTSQLFHGTAAELDTLCRDNYKLDWRPAARSY